MSSDSLYTKWFLALGGTHLCFTLGMGLFYLFPIFLQNNGADKTDVGLIMGLWSLSAVLARPLTTWMIEHLGRRRALYSGAVIFILAPLSYMAFEGPLENYYWPMLGVRVIHGIGLSVCMTTGFTWASDLVPPARLNEGVGMFGVSGLIAMAVGPVLGELIIKQSGFDLLFITASGLSVLPLWLVHKVPDVDRELGHGEPTARESFFTILVRRDVMAVNVIAIMFGIGMASHTNFVSLYAQQRQIGLVSIFFIAFSTAAVITRFFGGRLADRVGERKVIPVALVVSAIGFLGLVFAKSNTMFFLTGLFVGLGHGMIYPALAALVVRDRPYSIRPKMIAIYTGAVDGGVFAGSLLLGGIGEFWGFGALYLTACVASVLGLFFFPMTRQAEKPSAN